MTEPLKTKWKPFRGVQPPEWLFRLLYPGTFPSTPEKPTNALSLADILSGRVSATPPTKPTKPPVTIGAGGFALPAGVPPITPSPPQLSPFEQAVATTNESNMVSQLKAMGYSDDEIDTYFYDYTYNPDKTVKGVSFKTNVAQQVIATAYKRAQEQSARYKLGGEELSKEDYERKVETNYQARREAQARNASQNATISNPNLIAAAGRAQSMGIDVDWIQPALEKATYDKMMGQPVSVYAVSGGKSTQTQVDPETYVLDQLTKQINKAEVDQDRMVALRLSAQYPMLAARFSEIAARDVEKFTTQAPDFIGGRESIYEYQAPKFTDWFKSTPEATEQLKQDTIKGLTDYPDLYSRYLESKEPLAFKEWTSATPTRQTAFNIAEQEKFQPKSQGEYHLPRWAIPKARF